TDGYLRRDADCGNSANLATVERARRQINSRGAPWAAQRQTRGFDVAAAGGCQIGRPVGQASGVRGRLYRRKGGKDGGHHATRRFVTVGKCPLLRGRRG